MSEKKEKPTGEKICFVIMPFHGWFEVYYKEIYIPAIKNAGLTPRRADDLFRPGDIVKDIWVLTNKSEIILADLTRQNPNVFYELGLAHAIAKPVILITDNIDDIPFDLQSLRVLDYDKNQPEWSETLRKKITLSISEILDDPKKSILTTFLEIENSKKPKVTSLEKDISEIKQDLTALKRAIPSSGIPKFTPLLPGKTKVAIPTRDGFTPIPVTMYNDIREMIAVYTLEDRPEDDILYKILKKYNIPEKEFGEDIYNFIKGGDEIP